MIYSKQQLDRKACKTQFITLKNPEINNEKPIEISQAFNYSDNKDSSKRFKKKTIHTAYDNISSNENRQTIEEKNTKIIKKDDTFLDIEESKQVFMKTSLNHPIESINLNGTKIEMITKINIHEENVNSIDQQYINYSKENGKLKKELQSIIDKINLSIDTSSKELIQRDLLNHCDLSKLNQSTQLKVRELHNLKLNLNSLKKQYELIQCKSNDKKGIEK